MAASSANAASSSGGGGGGAGSAGRAGSAGDNDSDSVLVADIQVVGVEPTAFKQLLRYIYTGSCAEGALEAMADHLYEVADHYGVPEPQQLAARQMTASLNAEKVCEFFALAHAHENEMLTGTMRRSRSGDRARCWRRRR